MDNLKNYLNYGILESDNPFKKSKIKKTVYRCGEKELSQEDFEEVLWLSDKPIDRFGKMSKYYIDIQKPFVVECGGRGWCDKLWWVCCNEDGSPKMRPDDPKLLKMIPDDSIWKMVQEDTDEYEWGDLPYVVCRKYGDKYDSVIIKDIFETEACDIEVTDYCVFSMSQVSQA